MVGVVAEVVATVGACVVRGSTNKGAEVAA